MILWEVNDTDADAMAKSGELHICLTIFKDGKVRNIFTDLSPEDQNSKLVEKLTRFVAFSTEKAMTNLSKEYPDMQTYRYANVYAEEMVKSAFMPRKDSRG